MDFSLKNDGEVLGMMVPTELSEIAIDLSGRIFLLHCDGMLEVISPWNGGGKIVFKVEYSFGGNRFAINDDGTTCFSATFDSGKVAAYDVVSCKMKWQKKFGCVDSLVYDSHRDWIVCSSEDATYGLDATSGKCVYKLDGLSRIWVSRVLNEYLLESGRFIYQCPFGSEKNSIDRLSFAALSVAFGMGTYCVSEAGSVVRLISKSDGRVICCYKPENGRHVIHLSWCEALNVYSGIEWNYEEGGDYFLIHISEVGDKVLRVGSILHAGCLAFDPHGRYMINHAKEMVSLLDGEVLCLLS